ncbi:hypothetical protein C8R44DRAFT_892065 [Mycena epipterygia]|nr:hypothetical protein C8R44DRAFT_892065 [Mycena epipterygia]
MMVPILTLPTLVKLNATVSQDFDVSKVAAAWMVSFVSCIEGGDVAGVTKLFIDEPLCYRITDPFQRAATQAFSSSSPHWRDMLALTWDFHSFHGAPRPVQQPYPDIAWIQVIFHFETSVGLASGVVRLVPQPSCGPWRAHCMYTNLKDLKGFPEKIGGLRNSTANYGKWERERRHALSFEEEEPTVLVIGGGHSGESILE